MPAPFNNLRSKLDRAICAWLISQGCGSVDDLVPFLSVKELKYPNTKVHSTLSQPDEKFTGNRRVKIQISIKGAADPDEGESSRIEFDQRVAQTMDALMQTDDEQTLAFTAAAITTTGRAMAVDPTFGMDLTAAQFAKDNADMADFTCLEWYEAGEGDGLADAEGCAWEQVLMFEAVACPSAIN